MPQSQRPSKPACLVVGQDRRGRWVVSDPRGLCGRWFVDRAEAVRYAMFESASTPQSVIMAPGLIGSDAEAPEFSAIMPGE